MLENERRSPATEAIGKATTTDESPEGAPPLQRANRRGSPEIAQPPENGGHSRARRRFAGGWIAAPMLSAVRIDRVTVVRGAAYAGIFATAAALNTVVATTWVSADVVVWISTPIWCGGLIGATLIMTEKERRMAWLIAAWLVSALLMFAAVPNFWALVLHFRGEQVEATVTALRDGREKGRHLYYTLSYEGRRIPGELGRWPGSEIGAADNPEGRVGDRVTVVRDPHGLVDPRLPDELATAKAGQAPITGVLLGSLLALCVAAARPPRDAPASSLVGPAPLEHSSRGRSAWRPTRAQRRQRTRSRRRR